MSKEDELNSPGILQSAALDPILIGHKLPTIPPFTLPTGQTGSTGATKPTGIVSVIFRQISTPAPASTTLTLPAINVEVNQIVKLEGFFRSDYVSNPSLTEFSVSSVLNLVRDVTIIAIQVEAQTNIQKPANTQAYLTHNVSVIWVDMPPPGTYVYRLNMSASGVNISTSTIMDRNLTATVISI
ncbi:exosporium leader peptide-containing protein [Bacillus nitratireducens]|uniref:exosporium leader peptide-containing protein n=1 Tax=Bacillus nitratireducens TaxID=2026193 RepID=UPI0024143776|nr:exosporium leader peptide-containing protein [Bacillus nitratireducens]